MVQLIDFDKIDVIKVKEDELKTVRIDFVEDGLLDLPAKQLYDKLSAGVHNAIAAAAIFPIDNLYIEVNIKDNMADDDSLYCLCANIIAANLFVGKNRDREPRLKVPPIIDTDGLFGLIWLKRMVNEVLICDRIGGIIKINNKKMRLI